jgi:hypothetical protein
MRHLYPADWKDISARIRFERAQNVCECGGRCDRHDGACGARNRDPHPVTGSRVVLTVAHLDHDPTHNKEDNLRAMCQRCHLAYDRVQHRKTREARRA